MINVFMGGTTSGFDWRGVLENAFSDKAYENKLRLFNPLVDDWNEEAQANEIKERENADICLQVITPWIGGVYSIAEVTDDSNKKPTKTVFVVLDRESIMNGLVELESRGWIGPVIYEGEIPDFSNSMKHSLEATKRLIDSNGARVIVSLPDLVEYIANQVDISTIEEQVKNMADANKFNFYDPS